MKIISLVVVLLSLTAFSGFGQISAQWKGGHPGRPKDWTCASNWSNNKVPNEFTDVIITEQDITYNNYPEISKGLLDVRSLEIQNKAILVIDSNAQLNVHQKTASTIDLNRIIIKGKLKLEYKGQDILASR